MKRMFTIVVLLLQTIPGSLFAVEQSIGNKVKPIVDPLSGTNIVQMLVGLVVVLILVFAIAWLLRRVGGVNLTGSSALKIIAGMSMGSRERVVLLQVGEKQLLLGISPGRIQTLHVLETPIVVESKSLGSSVFANKLAAVLRGKNK